jgi:hypothetical protein
LGVQNMSIWAAMIDVDCVADDPVTAYLGVPARPLTRWDIGAPGPRRPAPPGR